MATDNQVPELSFGDRDMPEYVERLTYLESLEVRVSAGTALPERRGPACGTGPGR